MAPRQTPACCFSFITVALCYSAFFIDVWSERSTTIRIDLIDFETRLAVEWGTTEVAFKVNDDTLEDLIGRGLGPIKYDNVDCTVPPQASTRNTCDEFVGWASGTLVAAAIELASASLLCLLGVVFFMRPETNHHKLFWALAFVCAISSGIATFGWSYYCNRNIVEFLEDVLGLVGLTGGDEGDWIGPSMVLAPLGGLMALGSAFSLKALPPTYALTERTNLIQA